MRKQVRSMKEVTEALQKQLLISTNAAQHLSDEFSGPVLSLLTRTAKNRRSADKDDKIKITREKYAPELRSFALTLQFYSTKAYNYVRETFDFALPHVSTVRSWYAEVNGDPGWNEEAFKALEEKSKRCKAKNKKMPCAVMFDEISIKRHTEFDGKKYHGYVDVGGEIPTSDDKEEATAAMVFMVVSMNDHWKCPVGYFLVNGLSSDELANLVTESLTRLHNIEVDVRSVTFDGPPVHFSMCDKLGAKICDSDPRPWFPHPCAPNKRVYVILDPCHMIKLIRNNWCALKVMRNGKGEDISWYYIEQLYLYQEKEGVVAGNKLRRSHMEWKKNMKVKLAVQVLSRSVADALEF